MKDFENKLPVFTMITRHGLSKDEILFYTLISSKYQTQQLVRSQIIEGIIKKRFIVSNMGVENGKLVSTNGAIDNYTLLNSGGQVIGTPRAVILDRVEKNGKLVGYTIFTQSGSLAEVSVADAVALAERKLISNGKIRHTQDGDIVSAIGNTFPLREISIDKAPKGELEICPLFFGMISDTGVKYFGGLIKGSSASEMNEIRDEFSQSNARVVSSAVNSGGQSVRESLAIKRFSATGIYGVFELELFEKYAQRENTNITSANKGLPISVMHYTDKDGNFEEAVNEIGENWKVSKKSKASIAEVNKNLSDYTNLIISKFNGVIKISTSHHKDKSKTQKLGDSIRSKFKGN